jgi:hypothetical protein
MMLLDYDELSGHDFAKDERLECVEDDQLESVIDYFRGDDPVKVIKELCEMGALDIDIAYNFIK